MSLKIFSRKPVMALLMAAAVAVMTGCSSTYEEPEQECDDSVAMATTWLRLNVCLNNPLSEPTRAGQYGDYDFELPVSRYENIRSLRVIVASMTDGGPVVEISRRYDFDSDGVSQWSATYEVKANDRKRVYLIANADDADVEMADGTLLSDYVKGTRLTSAFLDAAIVLKESGVVADNGGDSARYIPMSEFFDVEVGPVAGSSKDHPYEADLFITRAASKFSFIIDPESTLSAPFEVKRIIIDNIAGKTWLFPHDTEYLPSKYTPSGEKYEGRLITTFTVPSDADARPLAMTPSGLSWNPASPGSASSWASPIYVAESALPAAGHYTISIEGKGVGCDDATVTLGPVTLDNLPSLPRNTHVVVKMKLSDADLSLNVDLVPYKSVTLDPDFGLDIKQSARL